MDHPAGDRILLRRQTYFQAYTNTYGELEELKRKYEEALMVEDVVGLVIPRLCSAFQ